MSSPAETRFSGFVIVEIRLFVRQEKKNAWPRNDISSHRKYQRPAAVEKTARKSGRDACQTAR
jgi:hypothetical protein